MGLRAFTSQLLCEQVIGRGLRRVSYETDADGLFLPEYVNVFGVPLSIFQDVEDGGTPPPPPKPSTQIEVVADRKAHEITWPNIERIDSVLKAKLTIDWDKVPSIELDPANSPISAEMAAALGGQTDLGKVTEIDLLRFENQFRLQRLLFLGARKAFEQFGKGRFKSNPEFLFLQLVKLVEAFWKTNKVHIPDLFHQDDLRRRVLFALNIDKTVQHLFQHLREQNLSDLEPIFNTDRPIASTGDMLTWFTTKAAYPTVKSHISHCVFDSTWEACEAYEVERNEHVAAYAKNDHLGFHVFYLWNGSKRKYIPDFLIRLKSGKHLILEVKGEDSQQNQAKRQALGEWIQAVNNKGGFGTWAADVSFAPSDIPGILKRHAG
jgi:type III restriction enzyme